MNTLPVAVPTNGLLTLNANGSFDYTHNGSETTSDSFTYRVTDGALSADATVTITITPVNYGPAIDLDDDDGDGVTPPATGSNYATTFTENSPARLIKDSADATITDPDSATLTTLTVTLTMLLDAGVDLLDVDLLTDGFDATFTEELRHYYDAGPGDPHDRRHRSAAGRGFPDAAPPRDLSAHRREPDRHAAGGDLRHPRRRRPRQHRDQHRDDRGD